MTEKTIRTKLKSILISNFNIDNNESIWEQPLAELQPNLKILEYLVFMEQLLKKEFKRDVPLLENISPEFHTPENIVSLIKSL